jgi:hypothetical protein
VARNSKTVCGLVWVWDPSALDNFSVR